MLELPQDSTRVGARLLAALLAGAQRQWSGKAAGLRTHMLVSLGTATLVVGCAEFGMGADPLSRVIQNPSRSPWRRNFAARSSDDKKCGR